MKCYLKLFQISFYSFKLKYSLKFLILKISLSILGFRSQLCSFNKCPTFQFRYSQQSSPAANTHFWLIIIQSQNFLTFKSLYCGILVILRPPQYLAHSGSPRMSLAACFHPWKLNFCCSRKTNYIQSIGGSRGVCPMHVSPLRVQILSF